MVSAAIAESAASRMKFEIVVRFTRAWRPKAAYSALVKQARAVAERRFLSGPFGLAMMPPMFCWKPF
jgi:hypothetical protein